MSETALSAPGSAVDPLPRVSAGLRLNVVFARVPDIIVDQSGAAQTVNETLGIPAPALGGNVSIGLLPGINLAPTIGGFGSVDLLGSATWLPFEALGVEGFGEVCPLGPAYLPAYGRRCPRRRVAR